MMVLCLPYSIIDSIVKRIVFLFLLETPDSHDYPTLFCTRRHPTTRPICCLGAAAADKL